MPNEKEIFNIARRLDSSEAVDAYLSQVCADDEQLRGRVEELLRIDEEATSFLEPPQDGVVAATVDQEIAEKPGSQIGPYKLLQVIGEGGMGVVYMAEQKEPVKRRVALKIIKPGMDTRQVIARFEAERQALAMMDHPGIAKVLDAGSTNSGRPYFAMELVRGIPITQYCDEQHLTPKERLALFVRVCQAVQHAHQKGIIHRDLKPSNILVALYDGEPVPKVIDFGVAKAVQWPSAGLMQHHRACDVVFYGHRKHRSEQSCRVGLAASEPASSSPTSPSNHLHSPASREASTDWESQGCPSPRR